MAIEIKELLIQVKVEEAPRKTEVYNPQLSFDKEALTADIVKRCTRKVLEILKEKSER